MIFYDSPSLTTPFIGSVGWRKLTRLGVDYAVEVDVNGELTNYVTCPLGIEVTASGISPSLFGPFSPCDGVGPFIPLYVASLPIQVGTQLYEDPYLTNPFTYSNPPGTYYIGLDGDPFGIAESGIITSIESCIPPAPTLYVDLNSALACTASGAYNLPTYAYSGGTTLCDCTSLNAANATSIPAGTYYVSDGIDSREFTSTGGGSTLLTASGSCFSCSGPIPTTTTTTTTAANFSNTIGFGGAPEDACLPTATGSVTGNASTFCTSTTFTGAIFAAAATGTWYVSFGGQVVSVSVINGNSLATVTSACSSC
jgi:hypothetical protein